MHDPNHHPGPDDRKGDHKDDRKGDHKDDRKGDHKDDRKDDRKGDHKDDRNGHHKDDRNGHHKPDRKDDRKGDHKGDHKDDRDHRLSSQDVHWLRTAAAGDLAEIEGGVLARHRAAHKETREYADRLIVDHWKAYQAKRHLADRLDVSLPNRPSADAREKLAKLRDKHGHDFDVAYLSHQVAMHKKAIDEAKKEISKGDHDSVVERAKHELPVLQKHLRHGERALDDVKDSGDDH